MDDTNPEALRKSELLSALLTEAGTTPLPDPADKALLLNIADQARHRAGRICTGLFNSDDRALFRADRAAQVERDKWIFRRRVVIQTDMLLVERFPDFWDRIDATQNLHDLLRTPKHAHLRLDPRCAP